MLNGYLIWLCKIKKKLDKNIKVLNTQSKTGELF